MGCKISRAPLIQVGGKIVFLPANQTKRPMKLTTALRTAANDAPQCASGIVERTVVLKTRPAAGQSDTCLRSYFLFHAIVLIPDFGLPFGYATFVHTYHWRLRLYPLGRCAWAPGARMNWSPSFRIWLVPHRRSTVDLPDSPNGRFQQTRPFRQGDTFFYTWCCILACFPL